MKEKNGLCEWQHLISDSQCKLEPV